MCCPWAIVFNENEDPQYPTEDFAGAKLWSIILRQKTRKKMVQRMRQTTVFHVSYDEFVCSLLEFCFLMYNRTHITLNEAFRNWPFTLIFAWIKFHQGWFIIEGPGQARATADVPGWNRPIMLRLQMHWSETGTERSTHTGLVMVVDNQPTILPPPETEKLQDNSGAQKHMVVGDTSSRRKISYVSYWAVSTQIHMQICKFLADASNVCHYICLTYIIIHLSKVSNPKRYS